MQGIASDISCPCINGSMVRFPSYSRPLRNAFQCSSGNRTHHIQAILRCPTGFEPVRPDSQSSGLPIKPTDTLGHAGVEPAKILLKSYSAWNRLPHKRLGWTGVEPVFMPLDRIWNDQVHTSQNKTQGSVQYQSPIPAFRSRIRYYIGF